MRSTVGSVDDSFCKSNWEEDEDQCELEVRVWPSPAHSL